VTHAATHRAGSTVGRVGPRDSREQYIRCVGRCLRSKELPPGDFPYAWLSIQCGKFAALAECLLECKSWRWLEKVERLKPARFAGEEPEKPRRVAILLGELLGRLPGRRLGGLIRKLKEKFRGDACPVSDLAALLNGQVNWMFLDDPYKVGTRVRAALKALKKTGEAAPAGASDWVLHVPQANPERIPAMERTERREYLMRAVDRFFPRRSGAYQNFLRQVGALYPHPISLDDLIWLAKNRIIRDEEQGFGEAL